MVERLEVHRFVLHRHKVDCSEVRWTLENLADLQSAVTEKNHLTDFANQIVITYTVTFPALIVRMYSLRLNSPDLVRRRKRCGVFIALNKNKK